MILLRSKVFIIIIIALCSSHQSFGSVADTSYSTYGDSEKIRQRFNPVYGSEKESNEIISFIASNLVVELEPRQLKMLNGYLVLNFMIDTLGHIGDFRVTKSYNQWVDYAILGAMTKLPEWGVIPRHKGEKTSKRHQIVFTFGSYVKGSETYGFQGDAVDRNIQSQINEQREAHFAKIKEEEERWESFTDDNGVIRYDTKEGLKDNQTILMPNDPLDPTNQPPQTPTITITEQ